MKKLEHIDMEKKLLKFFYLKEHKTLNFFISDQSSVFFYDFETKKTCDFIF